MPCKPKLLMLIVLALLIHVPLFSQHYDYDGLRDPTDYWEAAVTIGGNNFLGDLGGNKGKGKPLLKDYRFGNNRFLVGASGNYNLTNYAAFNFGLNFAQISDADSLINNTGDFERWRFYRNLSFKSNILEAYAGVTFYPVMYIQRRKIELHRINPFVSVGIGIFHFNPKTFYQGQWIKLQPLHLEGQGFPEYPDRKPYKLYQPYIPIQLGVKTYIDNHWSFATGATIRKTFTDYMDDISTTYIEPQLFDKYYTPEVALMARNLYSRSITPWKVKPGVVKANADDMDSYITFFATFYFRFEKYVPFYYPKM